MPLIVASILSKKLAAGLDALVMDVKVGSGAFLPSLDAARDLARNLVEVANEAGPALSRAADRHGPVPRPQRRQRARGARGDRPADRRAQGPAAARGDAGAGGRAVADGRPRCRCRRRAPARRARAGQRRCGRALRAHGRGARRPARPRWSGRRDISPHAPCSARCICRAPARSRSIDVRALGLAIIALGGGRTNPADAIDHAVGPERGSGARRAGRPGPAFRHRACPHRSRARSRRARSRSRRGRRRGSPDDAATTRSSRLSSEVDRSVPKALDRHDLQVQNSRRPKRSWELGRSSSGFVATSGQEGAQTA